MTSTVSSGSSGTLDAEARQLLSLVPRPILERPVMPSDCIWDCPIEDCTYSVNFKDKLPLSTIKVLSKEEIAFLSRKSWSSRANATISFSILVKVTNAHYKVHLSKLGLVISGVSVNYANFAVSDNAQKRIVSLQR